MTFSVHVATLADVPALATVSRAAFKDHPIVGYLGRDVPPEIFYTFLCQQYQQRFHTSPLTGVRTFKAIDDETGDIVGLARWQYPYSLSAEQKAEKEKLEKAAPAKPEGYNKELEEKTLGTLNKLRKKWVDDSKDCVLHGLAVSPNHQRRGLGSLLIRQGLAVADEAGARTYLEGSKAGVPLYLKHGFKQVDEILVDMRPYGGTKVESEKCMIREPGGR